MKKLMRPALIIGVSLFLALFSAALTCSAQATTLPNLSGATLFYQTTPPPPVEDRSSSLFLLPYLSAEKHGEGRKNLNKKERTKFRPLF
jgi:hypothetical protein